MDHTQIHWFPGHMAVALRQIKSLIKVVDIIVELIDARAPNSSRYPQIEELINRKMTLTILGKADLADEAITKKWIAHFSNANHHAIALNINHTKSTQKIIDQLHLINQIIKKNKPAKSLKNTPLKIMILGIPNVGKSTLINRLANRRSTRVGDRPGVTKATQWIRIKDNFLILDTPGILPSSYAAGMQARHLALLKSIRTKELDNEELGPYLYQFLCENYMHSVVNHYQLDENNIPAYEIFLFKLAEKQGLLENGVPSLKRATIRFLHDFHQGTIGKISLESID